MATIKAKAGKDEAIEIESISTVELDVCLIGTSPLLFNRLAEKARQELLMPAPKKNAAEKAMRLKHQPYDEFRRSVYRTPDGDGPTRLIFPGGAFRKAIASAALDVPGSSKAQIGRLVRIVEDNVSIFGVPQLSCMIVRQAGMNKTPDVRTRAILPEWACRLTIKFAHPLLKEKSIISLLAAAGDFIGVGDGRNEKGSSLSCGCFAIVSPDDPDFVRICKTGGLKAQDVALEKPTMFDSDTSELIEWFDAELTRRDFGSPSQNGRAKREKVTA